MLHAQVPSSTPDNAIKNRRNPSYGFTAIADVMGHPALVAILAATRDAILIIVDPERSTKQPPRRSSLYIKQRFFHMSIFGSQPLLNKKQFLDVYASQYGLLTPIKMDAMCKILQTHLQEQKPYLEPLGCELISQDGTIVARFLYKADGYETPLLNLRNQLDHEQDIPVWKAGTQRNTVITVTMCVIQMDKIPNKYAAVQAELEQASDKLHKLGRLPINRFQLISVYDKCTLSLPHMSLYASIEADLINKINLSVLKSEAIVSGDAQKGPFIVKTADKLPLHYKELMHDARLSFHKHFPFVINNLLEQGIEINIALIEPFGLWETIQTIFDGAMNATEEATLTYYKERFKNDVLRVLFKAGIPFVDGRSPVFWSTRFARNEAKKFALEQGAVTDCMAQEYLNKLLVGEAGEYNILFLLANPSLDASRKTQFPKLVKLFCGARAEIFAEEITHNTDAHIFFQDSLRIDNFFWNYELPIIRARGAKIILHRYDFNSHHWQEPFNMDSKIGQQIFLRRRSVYPGEVYDSHSVYKANNDILLWKQTFKDDALTQELENWAAPKKLTLGCLNSLSHFWLRKTKNFQPDETRLSLF